ncbi:preprotein translocase subunit SecE [Candidatus Babeliales bacterium]|nr:preprotein translocase subunit SecE [Candidatus Babeliales bacterium]MBP9843639.1 preprotein translocase subunit SecE [Candidatus Babeliales bacterium]
MKNIGMFLQEVKVELSKIVWPTREEFVGATIVALIVILAFTLFLSVVNYVFHVGAQNILAALVFNVR